MTKLTAIKEEQNNKERLSLSLVGRRSFPLGYIDMDSGLVVPANNLDEDYVQAVLIAAGTDTVQLVRQHLHDNLHEPSLLQIFPTQPVQVRAVGGKMVASGYRLFVATRSEEQQAIGYYALFMSSLAGHFFPQSEPPLRFEFSMELDRQTAAYQGLTAGLAELVSNVRRLGIAPHAVVGDIWSDDSTLVEQLNDEVLPEGEAAIEGYKLVRSYLVQLGAWRLRYHPPIYSLLTFGI